MHDLEKEGTWNPAWLGSHLLGGLTFHTRKMGLFLEHTLLFHCLPGLLLPRRLAHSRPQAFEQEAWDRADLHCYCNRPSTERQSPGSLTGPEVPMCHTLRSSWWSL